MIEIKKLSERLVALHQQAVIELSPQVQSIIANNCQDVACIEKILDLLLGNACTTEGLDLFKTLCRHYWKINAASTAVYINAYREMWDVKV